MSQKLENVMDLDFFFIYYLVNIIRGKLGCKAILKCTSACLYVELVSKGNKKIDTWKK